MTRQRCAPTRRAFLRGGLALAGLGLLSGCAQPRLPWQPSPVRRIGYLASNPDSTQHAAFRAGLRELGYVEGQNLSIDSRWAEGESDRHAPFTAELVALNVECIVTGSSPASFGAKAVNTSIPMVAVSGIIGGKALKGPADRMLASLGEEASALGVARRYASLISHFVLDRVDTSAEPAIRDLGVETLVTDTIMTDDAARTRLADEVLRFTTAPAGASR